jgi:phosphopantothenoylcysteine decarboxylase/phosphopantothenate--cysteine ligase
MLRDRVVVVGVSGGIAAYKACELVRRLRDRGATVLVVMTKAACEFVTPLTFQSLTGNPVVTDLWGEQRPRFNLPLESVGKVRGHVEHVDVAEAADAVVLAPATADLMARMVHGEAPDALTTFLLATAAPVVVAPAMDMQMWRAPATQANVRVLRARGLRFVGPDDGPLASGLTGPGRLADVAAIVEAVEGSLRLRTSMKGLRVLIGAGPHGGAAGPGARADESFERSDGFRAGRGGARSRRPGDRGRGPVSVDAPAGVDVVSVTTALQMERAMTERGPKANVVIMAAAVADYRPARPSPQKIKRDGGSPLEIKLEPNPDILAGLGAAKKKEQIVVGFALETNDGVENARKKLAAKNADLIVLNTPEEALGSDTNLVTLVEARAVTELPEASKREVAEHILDRVMELRGDTGKSANLKLAASPRAPKSRAAAPTGKAKR